MTIRITVIFILSYAFIALEHSVKITKGATAYFALVHCGTVYVSGSDDYSFIGAQLIDHLVNCIATGDSVSDLCMIKESGLGIAICSDESLLHHHADVVISNPGFSDRLTIAQ